MSCVVDYTTGPFHERRSHSTDLASTMVSKVSLRRDKIARSGYDHAKQSPQGNLTWYVWFLICNLQDTESMNREACFSATRLSMVAVGTW